MISGPLLVVSVLTLPFEVQWSPLHGFDDPSNEAAMSGIQVPHFHFCCL